MKVSVSYIVSHDIVIDIPPEEYLKLRANFEAVRKKVRAPQFRTRIEKFEPRDVEARMELEDYFDKKK